MNSVNSLRKVLCNTGNDLANSFRNGCYTKTDIPRQTVGKRPRERDWNPS